MLEVRESCVRRWANNGLSLTATAMKVSINTVGINMEIGNIEIQLGKMCEK